MKSKQTFVLKGKNGNTDLSCKGFMVSETEEEVEVIYNSDNSL